MKLPFSNLSLTHGLRFGFVAAIILVLAVGLVSFYTFRSQADESYMVRHTYQVLNKIEHIRNLLTSVEAGRRAFRSTNEKRFLQPYYDNIPKVGIALSQLEELTSDNPTQKELIIQAESKIQALFQYWRELGDNADKYTRNDILRISNQERAYMGAIQSVFQQMVNEENQLLNQRETESDELIKVAILVVIIGTLLILSIVILLIRVIITAFETRRRVEIRLQKNLQELGVLNRESDEQNWLLTGMLRINDSIQGNKNVHSLAQQTLSVVTDYLELPAGAFYLYQEKDNRLLQQVAMALPDTSKKEYALQEGIVGRAATSHDVLVVKNVPAEYWAVQSGSGKATPGEVICVPLWFDSELKGVMELATFHPLEERHISLLRSVMTNIGVSINAALDRERVQTLLEQVQAQKEELEQQQEELRQSNEELTRQTEMLQSSEEELRVQEEELRQINAELEEKNHAIEIARQALSLKAQELEITSKYKSEFLANMSHELRTPLNSVLILAQLLADNKAGNLNEKQIEYARIIHKSGSDLLELINDILDLSKIEAGKVDIQIEDTPVNAIIRDMTELFSVMADEKGVQFVTQVDPLVPTILQTDKQRLEQVIKNLLSNAFKFTPKGGTVTLAIDTQRPSGTLHMPALTTADEILAISVTDTGIGIPASKQQLIFEAFQQADGSTNRRFGGTGLGLSISRELVKLLGGEIELKSIEGHGSTFTIYLSLTGSKSQPTDFYNGTSPVTTDPSVLQRLVEEQTKLPDDRNDLAEGDNVLLVIEDDIRFASLLRDFARSKKYKAIVALQGDEGLQYARKYKPSAIILDMQLPVIDGQGVLRALKSDDALKSIPVHVITAFDESRLSIPGAMAYLRKPLGIEELENAFRLISSKIETPVKKVLVLSGNYLKDESLKRLIEERHLTFTCDYATSTEEALQMIAGQKYDSLIVDIGQDLEKGTAEVQQLQQALQDDSIPVIVYMDNDLSVPDERRLKQVSDVIIRDSLQAKDRLIDELELFLYKVRETEAQPLPQTAYDLTDTNLQGKKVLLVDDDMRNVFALSTLLEDQQMEVITAGDGKEALDLLNEHPDTDVVLMDIMMPEMDGYEATRRLRTDPRFTRLPVIALTAKAMPGDREKTIEAGASDYISKPIDSSRLFSLLRVWLAR